MAKKSNIEWTDATFNGWIGCSKISPACDNCYAAVSTPARTRGIQWGAGEPRVRTKTWGDPMRWNKTPFFECPDCGLRGEARDMGDVRQVEAGGACRHQNAEPARRRVFAFSLGDVFDNEAPAEWRIDFWDLIEATPNLDWLVLTKRIGNAKSMLPIRWEQPAARPKNLRLGATIATQAEADRDIPKLLALPYPNFLSMEPLLEAISIQPALWPLFGGSVLDWIIVGGESGPQARPMHPAWARSLRDQCAGAGVPFLFKQWGEWIPSESDDQPVYRGEHRFAGGVHFFKIGKEAAGRILDGRTHDGYPGEPA